MFLSFLGSLICPPTRTACTGAGASGSPPTTPPTTPPGTPPSTPPATPPWTPKSTSSGLTCSGTSTGAVNLGDSFSTGLGIGFGMFACLGAGGGGGGGGGGAEIGSTKKALTAAAGSGSSAGCSSGTMTIMTSAMPCRTRETGSSFPWPVLCATTSDSMRSSKSLRSIRRLTCFPTADGTFVERDRILIPGFGGCQGSGDSMVRIGHRPGVSGALDSSTVRCRKQPQSGTAAVNWRFKGGAVSALRQQAASGAGFTPAQRAGVQGQGIRIARSGSEHGHWRSEYLGGRRSPPLLDQ